MTALLTDLDKRLVARTRRDAEALRVQTLQDVTQANVIGNHLDDFARGLEDLIYDHLTPAEETLERSERLADMDPKGRRENARNETEAPR